MKTLVFIGFLASFSLSAQAQDGGTYAEFDDKSTAVLASDRVNIRESASTKAAVLATPPIGTTVTIEGSSETLLKQNGLEAPWYRVRFNQNGTNKTGYVWGGLISENVEYQTKTDVQFVYSVESVKYETVKYDGGEYETHSLRLQVRACKDGKELHKLSFDAVGGLMYTHQLFVDDAKGIPLVKNVLQFDFPGESCGSESGTVYVFWDGKQLLLAKQTSSFADYPVFAHEELLFPTDEGGKAGKLLLKTESGEYEEDKEEPTYNERSTKIFTWTGSELKLEK